MTRRILDLKVSDLEKIDRTYFENAVRVCMTSEYPNTDWYVLYENGFASIDLMYIEDSKGNKCIEVMMFDDCLRRVFVGAFAYNDIDEIFDTVYGVMNSLKRFLHTEKGE